MNKPVGIKLLAMTIALSAQSTFTHAQSSPGDAAQRGGAGLALDEIIVTAQRRSQNVLDVPMSITALPAEVLESTGIETMTDLRFNTPGFLTSTGSGYVQIFMRGIGNRIQIGADPSVTTFVDDTPRIYSSLVDDFSAVERVEVLKGAQGGLYGRNATAGVINIVTRQPDPEAFAGELKVGYGEKDTRETAGFINIPITAQLAVNFTAIKKGHDDYLDNKAIQNPYSSYAALSAAEAQAAGDTGQRQFLLDNPAIATLLDQASNVGHLGDKDSEYFAGKLYWEGENLRATLSYDHSDVDDTTALAWKSVQFTRTYGTYTALMNAFGLGAARLPLGYVYPTSGSENGYGEFEAANGSLSRNVLEDYGTSAKFDLDLPSVTLTSISSWRWNDSDFQNDVTGSAVPNAGFAARFERENFYQEFRAVSSGDGPFRWLGGVTYFDEDIDNFVASILLGNQLAPTTDKTGTEGYSYYLQGEFDLSDRITLIASGRYIDETKSADFPNAVVAIYDPQTDTITNGVSVSAVSDEFDTTKFLPSFTLSYSLDGGGNVYARYAKGIKTGGANPLVHPAQTLGELNALQPEKVDTYEVGLRTHFLDGRAQFTSAIFYNDYQELQVLKSGYTGLAAVYFNAGEAETYGAEVSLNWQATDIFNLTANLGYLNAEYTDFKSAGIPQLKVAPFDVSGNQMILAPEWQGSVIADFDVPLTDGINGVATVLYSYVDKFYTDDTNIEATSQDAYSLVNVRIGAETADEKYGFYISAKNVLDEEYVTWGSAAPSAHSVQIGAPRIIMGELEVKF